MDGPHRELSNLGVGFGLDQLEVVPTEKLLLGRLVVSHRAVKLGSNLELTRPVLGDEMCLERGEMRVGHRDQASFEHRGPAPRTILDRGSAREKAA